MVFDVTKPETKTRLNSEQIRDNFEAVGRASDLKCFAQDPPDLTLFVQPGIFYTITTSSITWAGGASPPIDTTTGGLPGQKRIVVVEMTQFGTVYLNYGSWVTPPTVPTAPTYSASSIALAEVLVTFNDSEIIDGQVTDIRPLINLGNAGTSMISPELQTYQATAGQTVFITTNFTFVPGADEILVWSGGVFQTPVVDYTEPNDHTVQFSVARPLNERVTIWKVGISAAPAALALADLTDVTTDEADAFHNADAADATNPFLTESGHNAIDHLTDVPSLAPVAVHITSTATTIVGMRHHAEEIEATDNFTFTSETNVQGVLDDLETNFYQKFLEEHESTGVHGPNVTITNTTTTEALLITQQGDVTATGSVKILQQGAGNALRLEKSSTTTQPCLQVLMTGAGHGVSIDQRGNNYGLYVTTTSVSTSPAVHINNEADDRAMQIVQFANNNGLYINKWGTGAGAVIHINNQGTGDGLYINNTRGANGIQINNQANSPTAALYVNNITTGSGRAVRVDNSSSGYTLYLNKITTTGGDVLAIANAGSGYDVYGSSGRWNVAKSGNANFADVRVGGGTGVATGFFSLAQGVNLTINSTGGITPTNSYHRVDTYASAASDNLDYINASSVPVGTILVLMSVNTARNVNVRNKAVGGNIDLHGGDDFLINTTDAVLTLLRQSTSASSGAWEWVEITRSTNE